MWPDPETELPESFAIRLSKEPRDFLWVCPLYFAPLRDSAVIACLRIITREDSQRSLTAITSLEASTATAAQCDGGAEDEGEGEGQTKRQAD